MSGKKAEPGKSIFGIYYTRHRADNNLQGNGVMSETPPSLLHLQKRLQCCQHYAPGFIVCPPRSIVGIPSPFYQTYAPPPSSCAGNRSGSRSFACTTPGYIGPPTSNDIPLSQAEHCNTGNGCKYSGPCSRFSP